MDVDRIVQAAQEYIDLREHRKQPTGAYDKSGFYAEPRYPCCGNTIKDNYDELAHARTIRHVSYAYGVPYRMLRASIRSVGQGRGVPPEVIAEYAAMRLRGESYPDAVPLPPPTVFDWTFFTMKRKGVKQKP